MPIKIFPRSISKHDQVDIVAPSSPIPQGRLTKVVEFLTKLGLDTRVGRTLQRSTDVYTGVQAGQIKAADLPTYDNCGYIAGSPRERADDILSATGSALFCLRGGYTALQTIPHLLNDERFSELVKRAPAISGYSDITPLINIIYDRASLITYHAPMITPNFTKPSMLDANGQPNQYSYDYWRKFLFTDWQQVELKNPVGRSLKTVVGGKASGDIVGGNLEELHWLCGTPYQINLHDKILFLEDVEVATTNLDVDLTQMKLAGLFDGVKGIILGDFVDCSNSSDGDLTGYESFTAEQLVIERLMEYAPHVPILAGLAVGHAVQTLTIPIGAHCELDADRQTIVVYRR